MLSKITDFIKRNAFMSTNEDKELNTYRNLMTPPEHYEDGFNWKSIVGALFLGLVMMPGVIYLNLVIGPLTQFPAQWVLIVLFAEVARRSFKQLKNQEVFVLWFLASLALIPPQQSILYRQFFVQSDYATAMGIAREVPWWFAPSTATIEATGNTFMAAVWIVPILIWAMSYAVTKVNQFALGYALYRITSDVEELPFPMAPVATSGITALVEESPTGSWRWRCFSIGGMFGLAFGALYIGFPAFTSVFLGKPINIIPIPWIDLTPQIGKILPAAPFNLSFDLALVFMGMVLPFWAVIGGFLGAVITMLANPALVSAGILSNWTLSMGVVDTMFTNNVDFYLSFSVGLMLAIALASVFKAVPGMIKASFVKRKVSELSDREVGEKKPSPWRRLVTNNVKRGDFSIFAAVGIYVLSSCSWIGLSAFLVEGFPWPFFLAFAFLYTPLISYAAAKMEGLTGQFINIPLVREATYILSGYKGVAVWFVPAPIPNYGRAVVAFRVQELTGTKLISRVKITLIGLPIILGAYVLFSQVLWQMAPVPSTAYPFANKMWDLYAKTMCLQFSATMEGGSLFMEAWEWRYFLGGIGGGLGTFILLSFFGLPTLLVFGVVRGLGQGTPANLTLELVGALVGRFYFLKRFGPNWRKYTPILLAGYACGTGLLALVTVSLTMISKMMAPLIY